jgi:hypothetical protein
MTAPIRPAPKSLDGRSARELYAYERTVDDGEEALPPATGVGRPPTVALPIYDGGTTRTLIAQPDAETDYGFGRPWYDASWANQMRIVADVKVAGATNAELFAWRSPDGTTRVEPGVSGAPVAVTIDAVGPRKSAWTDMAAASAADWVWGIWARNGNDSASPVIAKAHIQFRQRGALAPTPPTGDLGNPIHDLNAITLRDVVGLADNADVATWPDDSVSNLDGTCVGSPSFPKFRTTLWPGGLPCVRWTGNAAPITFGPPTNSAFTHYVVASGIDGGDVAEILAGDGYPRAKGLTAVGNTQIGGFVNNHVWFPTFLNVNDDWDMSLPHIYRFVFHLAEGTGRWYIFVDGECVTFDPSDSLPGVQCPPQSTESTVMSLCNNLGGIGMDALIARELCYDAAYITEGLNSVETALKATWGTP